VLNISDLHIPFQLQEVVDDTINDWASPDTFLVVNGDLVDSVQLSNFAYPATNPIIDNIMQANQLVREWTSKFAHVFILDGNHERRLTKYIGDRAKDLAFLVPGTLNYYVCRDISLDKDKLVDKGPLKNVTYIDSRFFVINNVAFIHPLNYLSTPGSTVKKAIETGMDKRINFDIMIIGHTHQLAMITHMGRIGLESGCMTLYSDYITKVGRLSKSPQLGYVTMEMTNSICTKFNIQNISYQALTLK